jgi:GT2 family glycosyltransferase
MDSHSVTNSGDAHESTLSAGRSRWLEEEQADFLELIADHVVGDISPSSVLVAGRDSESLAESLRRRGVEARSVELWQYAVTGPVQQYELVICLDDMERLPCDQMEAIIEGLCQHSDDVLITSSSPGEGCEAASAPVDFPTPRTELFARHGHFRDVDFDASFGGPQAGRYRKATGSLTQVILAYERRLWQLEHEVRARRDVGIEQHNELVEKEMLLQARTAELRKWQARWTELEQSTGWALLQKMQHWRERLAPPSSVREQVLEDVFQTLRTRQLKPLRSGLRRIGRDISWRARVLVWKIRLRINAPHSQTIYVDEIPSRAPLQPHQSAVEIVVCVHNALTDVRRCLESIINYTSLPYSLILVDDGSDSLTRDYLSEFADGRDILLLRNEEAKGYTRAANQGLQRSSAEYVVLLNSDTIVTQGWLDRLVACAESGPRIGLVGPLSNTASWQSIPELESCGDWAGNPLPPGTTLDEMGQLVGRYSARLYPSIPFLNGFCLLIRREVIDEIGYFDEETFGAGYGEEDDYTLRARKAGWTLAIADDAYVYHAQSRSYSSKARKHLSERAGMLLAKKHGPQVIREGVSACRRDRVLEGIRARSSAMLMRQEWIQKGREEFEGRRVLFVLPVFEPGGGANVVIDEAMAMREMGVSVAIFNLDAYRERFERAYPALEIPVLYGEENALGTLGSTFDAVIATYNPSVAWLGPIMQQEGYPVRGYYIQGFEPYMYPPCTEEFERALASYSLFPDLVRFTKTEWTQQEVRERTGVACALVGVSVNIDLFRPCPRPGPEWPERPLRIAAMIRANASYRAPKMTMEVLRRASRRYGAGVEVVIFGTSAESPDFAALPRNFAWTLAGILGQKQVANLLNTADVFVDFSSHQAMGLTALEVMGCGAAVIVPEHGGATSFARHEENSLVVDTSSSEVCWQALQRLIEDHDLRLRLQRRALIDVCDFFTERPAYNILNILFGCS